MSLKKTLLRRERGVGKHAFRVPNLGLESSFCRWFEWQRFAKKECFLQTLVGAKDCTPDIDASEISGFPVAFSNGCSVAFSNELSLSVVCSTGLSLSPADFQYNCAMDVYLCEFWRVISCPKKCNTSPPQDVPGSSPPRASAGGASHATVDLSW